MQEARLPSQVPQLTTQVPISILSFGLMGIICGVLTGVIDAMQSSGAYVLLGATSLHMIVGCVIGLICGLLYALSPRSLQLNYCIEMTQQFLSPPRQVSDYQRGRAVASVWLWTFVVNWVMPGSAALGHNLSARVSTPLFSMIISIAVLTLTGMVAVPFVAGAVSRRGSSGRSACVCRARGAELPVPVEIRIAYAGTNRRRCVGARGARRTRGASAGFGIGVLACAARWHRRGVPRA